MTTTTVRGAWVGKCPACGTCCYFPKFPATDYAGQRVVRPHNFDSVSVRCVCGRRFQTDSNGLTFVTCASLSIARLPFLRELCARSKEFLTEFKFFSFVSNGDSRTSFRTNCILVRHDSDRMPFTGFSAR